MADRTRLLRKAAITVILMTAGLSPGMRAQDREMPIIVIPEVPLPGEEIRVQVNLPYAEEPPFVTLGPETDTPRFVRGPVLEPGVIAKDGGGYDRVYRLFLTFIAEEPGYTFLPSLRIDYGGRIITIPARRLGIGFIDEGRAVIPPKPVWILSRPFLYENETGLLTLMAEDSEEPAVLLQLPDISIKNCFLEALETPPAPPSGTGGLFDVPVGKFLITPLTADTLIIPSAELVLGGITLKTPERKVPVIPMPAEAASGAVGSFSFSAWLDASDSQDADITLHVRASGRGNLPFITLPVPSGTGVLLTAAGESGVIETGDGGYSGSRENFYKLEVVSQPSSIQVGSFSWLDPDTGSVNTSEVIVLDVPFSNQETGRETQPGTREQPVLVRKTDRETVKVRIHAWYAGYLFSRPLAENPYTLYNRASAEMSAGNFPEAVFLLRKAVFLKPMDRDLRESLGMTEEYLGITQSVLPWPGLHPDLFLAAAVLFAAGSCLVIGARKKRKILFAAGLTVFLFLLLVSGAAFGYLTRQFSTPAGVAMEECPVFRIPEKGSSSREVLKPGTCVSLGQEYGDYRFIRTGTGAAGWCLKSFVKIIERS